MKHTPQSPLWCWQHDGRSAPIFRRLVRKLSAWAWSDQIRQERGLAKQSDNDWQREMKRKRDEIDRFSKLTARQGAALTGIRMVIRKSQAHVRWPALAIPIQHELDRANEP